MNFATLISCFISVKHKLKPRDCHIILCLGLGVDICVCRGGRGHLTKVLIFLFFPHMHTFFVLNLQLYIITLEAGVCAKSICILQSQARTPLQVVEDAFPHDVVHSTDSSNHQSSQPTISAFLSPRAT